MFSRLRLLLILILLFLTRFLFVDWGHGFYFHPDENNMASAVTKLSYHNLNPHFFAYGQFPLYLSFAFIQIFHLFTRQGIILADFAESIISLRLISAFFSVLTVFYFYKIGQQIFTKNNNYLFILLLIFCPGLIQLAHFGTTESILIFVFTYALYFSIDNNISKLSFIRFIIAGLILSIGVASKISALIFIFPILISYYRHPKHLIVFFVSLLFFSFLLSPFNFLSFSEFKSSMAYETAVAKGITDVFYTRQFKYTIPYLFQFIKVFPYALGLPIFVSSIISLYQVKRNQKINLILFSSLIYFLYFGLLYVKWYRFVSPLFSVFVLIASLYILNIKNKFYKYFLFYLSLVPGLIYLFNNYFQASTRVLASDWINTNIPINSQILSEDRNVIGLPLSNSQNYQIHEFNFYDLDSDVVSQQQLTAYLDHVDYIIIPSRRVYKNHSRFIFPKTYQYYQDLFSGKLKYSLVAKFNNHQSFPLDPNYAEETFSVFDNPEIMIFKKNEN